jgi:Golgi phosphoprotein 3
MADQLYLHEEIMLLALRDREGTVASGIYCDYALGGAVLAELLLQKRAVVDQEKKKKFLRLTDATPFGDPVMDECIQKVKSTKRRAQLQTWVSRFAGVKKLKHRVAEQLCRRGILRTDEDKVLLFFSRKLYPEINPEPERNIMKRLNDAIFGDSEDVDPHTVVVLSLANSANILKVNFDKKELKARKKRIEQVAEGEMTGKATKEAIEAMQAAVMVAVIVPTIIASTTTRH